MSAALGRRDGEAAGSGRESAIRALQARGSRSVDKDVTPIPHNGCGAQAPPGLAVTDGRVLTRAFRVPVSRLPV